MALFGDSLAWEAQPYYAKLLEAAKETAHTYDSYGGTAICDWFTQMRDVEARYHPGAVELEFSGNSLTPCMGGRQLYSTSYYEKYRADTQEAIKIFAPGGAHVYLIGAPITRQQQSVSGWQRLNLQYKEIADADPSRVTYIDAGTVVEGSDHTYTDTLPCLTDEPCTGPVVNGVASNIVRSTDGTHFCPSAEGDKEGVIGGCTVYSSGAYRFAKAMVEALVMRQRRPDTEGRTLRVGLAAARWPTFRSTDRPTAHMTRRANGVDPTTTAASVAVTEPACSAA